MVNPAGGILESATHEFPVGVDPVPVEEVEIELRVYEPSSHLFRSVASVHMESAVSLDGDFRVADRDYLENSDNDGVGDINERLEGTIPEDSESTPEEAT